ncbi:MAG: hypothetical protein ABI851_10275 [Saprospiraceae bacterium]
MLNGRIYTYESRGGIAQRILGALAFLLIIILCFYLFFQIYKLLFYLSPLFILIALIIYPKIVSNHIKMIANSFSNNVLGGFLELGLQFVGLPLVTIGLVIKAWAYKKFGQVRDKPESANQFEERFSTYEDVQEETIERTEISRLEVQKKESNNYDDLFE